MLCAYIDDGGTQHANCADSERPNRRRGRATASVNLDKDCIPGCSHALGFCKAATPREPWGNHCICGKDWCHGRPQPWAPDDLDTMLTQYQQFGSQYWAGGGQSSGYNEVIIDGRHWYDNVPDAVEAVFIVKAAHHLSKEVAAEVRAAEGFARQLHRDFCNHYRLSEAQFPLLQLRVDDWNEPFHVIANGERA